MLNFFILKSLLYALFVTPTGKQFFKKNQSLFGGFVTYMPNSQGNLEKESSVENVDTFMAKGHNDFCPK